MNIIIIGDQATGKTSFVDRLTKNTFSSSYCTTLAKDLHVIEFRGKTIYLHDHGGSPRYQDLRQLHYKLADGVILFCDNKFNVEPWLKLLEKENPGVPVVIVMNKIDNPFVPQPKGADVYISCKSNYNLENVLPKLVPQIKEPEVKISPLESWFEYLPPYCSIS